MTRETKIGLLVGLAFIIVIGILLSDHLTSSTEPPPAPLAGAGSSVRSGVTTPAGQGNPPITGFVNTPQVSPQQQVPTRNEVAGNDSPVQIDVGGPRTRSNERSESPVEVADASQAHNDAARNTPPTEHQLASGADATVNAALRNAAHQQGEEVVTVGSQPQQNQPTNANSSAQRAPAPSGAAMTKYAAAEGDTVSKMALKFLGANTKTNRDAIVAANPSMKADPNKVIVGRVYMIPTSSAGVVTSVTTSSPPSTPPITVASPQQSPPVRENWYTVREGDSLWKIATEQCGGPGAIEAIKELNKETLKGGETVLVNQKLRLPSKSQVASN